MYIKITYSNGFCGCDESETEACKIYNCTRGTIGRACNGKRKTALEKHWKWVEEEN